MMRVHLLFEHDRNGDPHGCSEIRLLRPLRHPSLQGQLTVSAATDLPDETVDLVVVERMWHDGFGMDAAESLLRRVDERGAALVYTLDDNLLDHHLGQPWRGGPGEEQRMAMRLLAREAAGVIVSTHPLGERMRRLNPRVEVVENALDEQLFVPRSRPATVDGEPLTVGYMGTFSHQQDLMMVLQPLREVLRRHQGKVRFQMLGVSVDPALAELFAGLPFELLDNREFYRYPDFVAWAGRNLAWDLGIAPLEATPLNRCKSDIKYLDYALLGIPGIYSKGPAYGSSVAHRETGWLVAEEPEAWAEMLEEAVAQPQLRGSIAERAASSVRATRTLAVSAGNWLKALRRLRG
ncbi:glycosyltransferase family protein [Endothiovibrio diazotrophicus]